MALSFWTPDMIERAAPRGKQQTPLSLKDPEHGHAIIVSDTDRKRPPYQSVGVLFFTVNRTPCIGTAYATNASGAKNVVFTAAHNLVDSAGHSNNILFIPGVLSDSSRPYGEFPQIPGGKGTAFFVHPKYDIHDEPDSYDLGAVKLHKNANGMDLGDAVTLLDIAIDKSYTKRDVFIAIGYPEKSCMQESIGNYMSSEDEGETIVKVSQLPKGSSGCPWLYEGTNVNGNTASGGDDELTSPYFSKDKIEAIVNQM